MKTLYCLVGETSRGKDTVAKYMQKQYNMKPVISYTTRPMRKGEQQGVEHYFIDDSTADKMLATKDNIAAYTKIGDFRYFSTIEEVAKSDIYIIDPNGLDNLYIGNADIKIVTLYITSDLELARKRAIKRGDDLTAFEERVIAEEQQFKKFRKEENFDWKINNTKGLADLYHAVDLIISWVKYDLS